MRVGEPPSDQCGWRIITKGRSVVWRIASEDELPVGESSPSDQCWWIKSKSRRPETPASFFVTPRCGLRVGIGGCGASGCRCAKHAPKRRPWAGLPRCTRHERRSGMGPPECESLCPKTYQNFTRTPKRRRWAGLPAPFVRATILQLAAQEVVIGSAIS